MSCSKPEDLFINEDIFIERFIENHFKDVPLPFYYHSMNTSVINDPDTAVAGSDKAKSFRRKFRVPFLIFEFLVEECKHHEVFSQQRQRIPVEIKVLIGLCILGRGNCADDIAEMTGL